MIDGNSNPLRKQAWDYFAIHASQRMSVFNYYIVLSSLITTGYFASLRADSHIEKAGPALGLLLSLFSFIFWQLDKRTRFLIKNGEEALSRFEESDPGDLVTKVFSNEKDKTAQARARNFTTALLWKWQLSYSDCLNSVFFLFAVAGMAGVIYSSATLHARATGQISPLPVAPAHFRQAKELRESAISQLDLSLQDYRDAARNYEEMASPLHGSKAFRSRPELLSAAARAHSAAASAMLQKADILNQLDRK
jgi:hypothetical protein